MEEVGRRLDKNKERLRLVFSSDGSKNFMSSQRVSVFFLSTHDIMQYKHR